MSAALDVPEGYKLTEVGVIPGDWEVRALLKTVRIANGQVDPRVEPYASMVLVAPDHIESETGRLLAQQTASEQRAISGKYLFAVGDIIYSKIRPYLKKAVIADFIGICSADMYPLTPATDVSSGFMLATLLDHRFSNYAESVSVRSGMPKINRVELADFMVALPPKDEQRAIATALSDVDALLAKLDQLIAKKRDLKQAAMQQLLTGQTRLPGFSEEWVLRPLASVVSGLEAGVSVNSVDHIDPHNSTEPCILKTSAVFSGSFDPTECKLIDHRDLSRAKLSPRKDSIIISRMNTPNLVGEVGYVAQDFPNLNLPDRLWMTRFGSGADVSARWLAYVMSSTQVKEVIKGLATGTSGSMKNIAKGALLSLQLTFPSYAEQTAIATLLSDMDAEIKALEARQGKTRALRQGMMQALLTGRIRLV